MKTFLKWFAIFLAVLLVLALIGAAAFVVGLPLWQVAVVVAAAAVVVALGVFAVQAAVRARKRAVARASSAAAEAGQGPEETERRRAVARKWKEFLREVRHAGGKGQGDPLHALPWYLFLGEPGSGKTTAIRNSQVAVPSAARSGGAGGTPLECRVLEAAIAVDAPGYYTVPRDRADAAEWSEFLSLLAGSRKQEPLNGVVLTLAADALLGRGDEELRQTGVALRQRIDELADRLGVHVPVYLMVTKCDLVGGMVRFVGYLPEVCTVQALGALNDERKLERPQGEFLDRLFDRVYDRLGEIRLTLLGEVRPDELPPEALLFPEEFLDLKAPLARLLDSLMEKNPYRESPFFRGLYFSSGRQEGLPVSRYLSRLNLREELVPHRGAERSLFLRDWFEKILARDRALVAPTSRALGWSRLTQGVALGGWLVACVAVGVLLSVSFARNLTVIRGAANRTPPSPYLGQEFVGNLEMLDQLRQAVSETRERNRDWLLPRLGLTQSEGLERQLTAAYAGRLRRGVLDPFDEDLDRQLDAVAAKADPGQVARHVNFLSTRARLVEQAVGGERSPEELARAGEPDFGMILPGLVGNRAAELAPVVSRDYLSYLAWQDDERQLSQELEGDRARLKNFLTRPGIGFAWLIEWANLQTGLEPVTLGRYWGAEPTAASGERTSIDRAFTPGGWERIHAFLDEITGSMAGEAGVQDALARFQADYGRRYLGQWEGFLEAFPRGFGTWTGGDRRREMAGRLARPDSPYRRVLADVPDGIEPGVALAKAEADVPAWVPLVYRYQRLQSPEYQRLLKGEGGGVIGKLATTGEKVLGGLRARLRGEDAQDQTLAQDRAAAPFLATYEETLRQAAAQVVSAQAAYGLVRDTFAEVGVRVGEPEKAVAKNFWSQSKLKGVYSRGNPREDVFWRLLARPAEQVWSVLVDEAEPYLQGRWEEEVLADAKGLHGWEQVDALLGPAGRVWAFHDKYAAPLLTRDERRGYVPRELYGSSVPFADGFLRVLNLGKLGGKALDTGYRVQVAVRPTGANPGATLQPHRTTLVLQCGSGNQDVVNLNYPISRTLTWTPRDCSDVVLEIAVGDAILTKRYGGYTGFIQFLSDFRSGSQVFRAEDFPDQSRMLSAYHVKNITVSYDFKGEGQVLALARYYPSVVPQRVVE